MSPAKPSPAKASPPKASPAKASPASGLIIVDKPPGWTSHDVVAKVRRLAGTRRVGHAGTLDPMATGVLVIGVEKATRLLGHLTLTEKEYLATIRLGQATDTGDAEGTVTATADVSGLTEDAVRAATATLTGPIQQVPPTVSAIKVGGKRSYALTRAGQAPELPARPVTVWSFEVLSSRWAVPAKDVPAENVPAEDVPAEDVPARDVPAEDVAGEGVAGEGVPGEGAAGGAPAADPPAGDTPAGRVLDVDVSVRCSSGTYVRALARDLGEALRAGGHLTMLRRTRVGPYGLGQARTLDELAATLTILPIGQAAAAAFPARHLTQAETEAVSHGRRLPGDGSAPGSAPIAAFAPDGTFVALLEEKDGQARPLAVFA